MRLRRTLLGRIALALGVCVVVYFAVYAAFLIAIFHDGGFTPG